MWKVIEIMNVKCIIMPGHITGKLSIFPDNVRVFILHICLFVEVEISDLNSD